MFAFDLPIFVLSYLYELLRGSLWKIIKSKKVKMSQRFVIYFNLNFSDFD